MKRYAALLTVLTGLLFAQAALAQDIVSIANEGVTGTSANKLAKLTGAPSAAIITALTDSDGAVGVVVSGAGTTGNAYVAVLGLPSCVFDGGTTAGDYVTISTSVAGACHDAGPTRPSNSQVLGRVLTTNVPAGTYQIQMERNFSGAGGGGTPGGLSGQVQYNNGGTFGGLAIGAGLQNSGGTLLIPGGAVTNSMLLNSSITLNAHNLALGGSLTLNFADFSGTIAATQLPNPSATTLGGVESVAAVSNQWLDSISNLGVPHLSQPSFASLSGNIAVGQMASGSGASATTCFFGDNTWKVCGGGSTTFTIGPGLTNAVGTYNTGAQTIGNGSTLSLQLTKNPLALSTTLAATDTAKITWPTAAGLTFKVPNPGVTGNPAFYFGTDGVNSYTLTTVAGTATFYGSPHCTGGTSATIPKNIALQVFDDGTNVQCAETLATSGSANTPLFNDGNGGFTNGTRHGNTTDVATVSGALTSGNLVKSDINGNLIDGGAAGGGGITCPTGFTASGADCVWTISTASTTGCGTINCFAFTGLTGNSYKLACRNVLPSAGGVISVQFGESTGPTWMTSSTGYQAQGAYQTAGTAPVAGSSGATTPGFFGLGGFTTTGNVGISFEANFYGLASAKNKVFHGQWFGVDATPAYYAGFQSGAFLTDINVITAIRVIDTQATPASLTAGSCTLHYNGV